MFVQSTQTWIALPQWEPGCQSGETCTEGGLEWFPDRNSLLVVDGLGGIYECVFTGANSNGAPCASWTVLSNAQQFMGMGKYDNIAIYSPLCHCVIGGGGNGTTALFAYQANGTFKTLGASPLGLDIAQGGTGQNWGRDPVTGKFIVINSPNCELWVYDPQQDTWTDNGTTAPNCPVAEKGIAQTVPFPLDSYGVIAYVYEGSSGGNGTVWLYKAN
jgi:hypothetical protein